MRKLTAKEKRDITRIAEQDIDLSDMPEVLDWSKAEIGKFYRPPKKPVTMRLDGDIIEWLKGFGRGYQTRANLLLRHAMTSSRKTHVKANPGSRRKKPRRFHVA